MVKEKKRGTEGGGSAGTSGQHPSQDGTLPPHLDLQRSRVICGPDMNYNVSDINEPALLLSKSILGGSSNGAVA